MSNRGRELPHRCDAISVCQLHLELAAAPLAFAYFRLGTLAFGQVESKGDALVAFFVERRDTDQHRNAGPILAEIFLFERLQAAAQLNFRHKLLNIAVEPFRRCEIGPTQAAGGKILTIVSDDVEKRIVGLSYLTLDIPGEDPDYIDLDETPELGFALFELSVQCC